MSNYWLFLFFLTAYVLAPVFISKLFLRASWRQVGTAYGVYLGLMAVAVIGSLQDAPQTAGWMAILGIFFTAPGIPTIIFFLRRGGFLGPKHMAGRTP